MTQIFSDIPRPIAIVGLGITGTAVQNLLMAGGVPSSEIFTFDEKSPRANFKESQRLMTEIAPKTLVVSPGIPLASDWIQTAKKNGIYITSELSLAYRLLSSEKVISITGSVGKSTTTCLLRAALEQFSSSFFVGGNLGIPLAIYATDLLNRKRSTADWVVLELSSYQLENFPELKSEFSVITHLTSNHLERYPSKEEYFQTKWNLENHTKSYFVLNKNGGELQSWATTKVPKTPWIWTDRNSIAVNQHRLNDCQLLGSHNLDNIALAAEIVQQAKWPKSAFLGLKEFSGLAHRVENLGVKLGVRYINDSKATTMESVRIAVASVLESMESNQKLHLLLGGKDKNLPWEELSFLSNNSQIQFYFFGQCRGIAQTKSLLNGQSYEAMIAACDSARKNAKPGDSVLLSPGGTSLDEFKNFEHRGDIFKEFVSNIK
ncbi:MAG: hypothetical protein RJB66_1210 [Pseudomonadota bacterium]|jgi:UDP-N-acetylmuramoylalanine--D-glutamate ligase